MVSVLTLYGKMKNDLTCLSIAVTAKNIYRNGLRKK